MPTTVFEQPGCSSGGNLPWQHRLGRRRAENDEDFAGDAAKEAKQVRIPWRARCRRVPRSRPSGRRTDACHALAQREQASRPYWPIVSAIAPTATMANSRNLKCIASTPRRACGGAEINRDPAKRELVEGAGLARRSTTRERRASGSSTSKGLAM